MSTYNLLTLHAGIMLENYSVVQMENKNNKVLYRYDLSSTSSLDQEVILSEDQYADNALFYQLKKCMGVYDKPLNASDDNNDKDILKQTIIFVDFKDVFFKEKTFDTSEDYRSLSEAKLTHDKSVGYRLQWMFDSENGGIELIFDNTQIENPVAFVPFEKSSNMARNCQMSFIRKDMKKAADERLLLGIDFSPIQVVYSKYYAYRGLYLSTGYRIEQDRSYEKENIENNATNDDMKLLLNAETVIVLHDDKVCETKHVFSAHRPDAATSPALTEIKNIQKSKESDGDDALWTCEAMDKNVELNFFDGEGLICPQYASAIRDQLRTSYHFRKDSHSFQIRMPFIKGMLHEVDYCKFIDEQAPALGKKGEWIVKDVFDKPRDLKKAKIILTESMFKCVGWLKNLVSHYEEILKTNGADVPKIVASLLSDPMDYFFRQMEQYDHALYITGSDARLSNNGKIRLNYQFLCTLDIDFADFDNLVKVHRNRINNVDAAFQRHGKQSIYTPESICKNSTMHNIGGSGNTIVKDADGAVADEDLSRKQGDDDKIARWDIQEIHNTAEAVEEGDVDNSSENDGEGNGNAVRSETVRGKCLSALARNGGFIGESQVRNIIDEVKKTYERNLCVGRLEVAGEQRYLSRDLLSMLIYILGLVEDFEGKDILVANLKGKCLYTENMERFYMPPGKIRILKHYDYGFLRNPHLSRNEQCLLRPYVEPDSLYETYFSHLTGVVMVAYKSMIPMALSGADFDGDLVKIVAEKKIVDAIRRGVYNSSRVTLADGKGKVTVYTRKKNREEIDIPSIHASAQDYPTSVPFSVIVDTFANQVGQISNIAVTIAKHEYADSQEKKYTNKCSECTIVTGLEIDAAKTGVHPDANIVQLKRLVKDERNDFLKAKDCIVAMGRNHRYFTPRVEEAKDGRLSMYASRKKRTPLKNMSKIVLYSGSNPPQAMIDHLPGQYLDYLKERQDKKGSGTTARTPLSRNRILFCFQTQNRWKDDLNQDDKEKVAGLVYAYVQIRKLARQLDAMRQRSKSSKYIGHILTILSVQYDSLDKAFDAGISVKAALAKTYAEVKEALTAAETENATTPVNEALKKLDKERWQFTKNAGKKAKILKVLACKKISNTSLRLLSNFSNSGFMIFYYILKDFQSSKYAEIDVDDYVDDAIQKGEAKFDRPKDNAYYNELYSEYSQGNNQSKRVWNGNLINRCRRYLADWFGDMSLALKYVFSVSSKDPRREFLWNVFSEDEILWNVYARPLNIQVAWDKIQVSTLEKIANGPYSTVMKRLGNMYMTGDRVEKDVRKAEDWYFKAADLCDMEALAALANIYRAGNRHQQAAMCYRKLADLGDETAKAELERMNNTQKVNNNA